MFIDLKLNLKLIYLQVPHGIKPFLSVARKNRAFWGKASIF